LIRHLDIAEYCEPDAPLDIGNKFSDTPGECFYVNLKPGAAQEQLLHFEEGTDAFHGTALDKLPSILFGGLAIGPNQTAGKAMIYCEGERRKSSVWHYVTHVDAFREFPYHMVGVILECIADRSAGSTIHRQWIQPPNKIAVTAMIFHVIHLYNFTKKPWLGWYRLGGRVFNQYRLSLEYSKEDKWQALDLPGHRRCVQRILCVGTTTSKLIAHCQDGEPQSLYCEECFTVAQKYMKSGHVHCKPLEGTPWPQEETLPFSLKTETVEVEKTANSRAGSSTD
jgi:hypothetical protein